jgi:hypothetical protein
VQDLLGITGDVRVRELIRHIIKDDISAAASISITSSALPSVIALHISQVLHGSPLPPVVVQFTAFARIRAVLVLPVPRGPQKR